MGPLALAERAADDAAEKSDNKAVVASETKAAEAAPHGKQAGKDEDDAEPKSSRRSHGNSDADAAPHRGRGAASKSSTGFEGVFAGDDVAVYKLPGLPDRKLLDDKARIRVEKNAESAVRLTIVNSDDGSDMCQLSAHVDGNTAVLDPAQPCFASEGEDEDSGGMQGELTSGRAVLEGDDLKFEAQGTLAVSFPDQELEGELTYAFKGRRQ